MSFLTSRRSLEVCGNPLNRRRQLPPSGFYDVAVCMNEASGKRAGYQVDALDGDEIKKWEESLGWKRFLAENLREGGESKVMWELRRWVLSSDHDRSPRQPSWVTLYAVSTEREIPTS